MTTTNGVFVGPASATASRILRDQPWADVVLDLRANRTIPMPTRPFGGRRKATPGDVVIGVHTTENVADTDDEPTFHVRCIDPDGFVLGLALDGEGQGRPAHSLPLLNHLFHPPGYRYKNVVEPQRRAEAAFARLGLPALRRLVETDAVSEPVERATTPLKSMKTRVAWASVGVDDLGTLDDFLAPTKTVGAREWYSGAVLVATWLKCGFTSIEDVTLWVTKRYPALMDAVSASFDNSAVENLSRWHHAGFTPAETDVWVEASQFVYSSHQSATTGFSAPMHRQLAPEACAQARQTGVTPEQLRWLCSSIKPESGEVAASEAVLSWLRVGTPERVCRYIAAGLSKREARRLERSSQPPSDQQLQVMAALRSDLPDLPSPF